MWSFVIALSVFLVAASPCPEFKCLTGDCVSSGAACDFRNDCQDGSDEEFCGSCDFERHSCGWNDTGGGSYSWTRQSANSSAVPGYDHTTGSSAGFVMQIKVKGRLDRSQKATLEFPLDSVLGLGCSLMFWYHIYDTQTHALSDLKIKMVRGSREKELMSIVKSNTKGWEKATVFIGNQPKGYKLQFVSMRSFMGHSDIKLDDISFNNCAEDDKPPASDQLSCDFEKDACSWYHDYTASFLWVRSKYEFGENPEVSGYHMILMTDKKENINSTARLVSFPQLAHEALCVSFWYHMFGNSIGSLKFITKHPGEEETVVWMRSGTQGNKWRFADLTFQSDKPIQFIIEAVVGETRGSISIDDIVVSRGSNGSCPAERECTFQGSMCGLQPFGGLGWTRTKGSALPANATGPEADHTLGTGQGYYLSSRLWSLAAASKVSVITAEMGPTAAGGECLMFWYHMEGLGGGEINVYIQTRQNTAELVRVWRRRGDQGSHWRHGRITLHRPNHRFKVIFEAVAGPEPKGNIALDDLIVLNDACPPQGFCDFEMDFCGWVNSPPAQSGLQWDWLSGSSSGKVRFIPGRDHSLGSRFGHFAFFTNTNPNETARLESEMMDAVDKACLELWHFSSAWSVGHPSDFILTVLISENDSLRPLWSTNGFLNNSWIHGIVDYSALGPHKIVLEATCPKSDCGSISLDDVHIIRDLIPTTTVAPPTTAAPPSAMDCTFEQGLCTWAPEVGADVNWMLINGLNMDPPWHGPQYDHTLGNNQGFFLLLNGSGAADGEEASISAPVPDVFSEFCVEFWFYMSGPGVSSLDLLLQTKSSELLVWTRHGTQDRKWIKAQVNISKNDFKKLTFSAHRNTDSKGFIAMDDVSVKSGVCPNQNVCGFDSGWCNYENDVSSVGRWSRTKSTKMSPDHTYRTEHGFYASVLLSNPDQTEVAQLLTHELPAAAEMCVRFWYQLPAESSNTLAVHVLWAGEVHEKLWESSSSASLHWEVAEVTVWAPAKYHVVFKAFVGPKMTSTVKIDDVSVEKGACRPRGSCDFESGRCTWVNRRTEGGHDWVLSSGGITGPATDHTIQTSDGVFLLSSGRPLCLSRAQVVSEWILPLETPACFSFWSYMQRDSGTLQFQIHSELVQENLTFNINTSGAEWTRFSHNFTMTSKPFRFLIEAETKPRGFIAVDDVSISPGLCQVNESTPEFVGCSFENDTCGWQDKSSGRLKWVRDGNGTIGNKKGWYMTVKELRAEKENPAVLLSPIMQQASAQCTLHFSYNMLTPEMDELNMFLQSDPGTSSLLWWSSGHHGGEWSGAEVALGRVPGDFVIRFEAGTSSGPGPVAIDDVGFSMCALPEPQPSCPEMMFTCKNQACVEISRVCDFSDDCGDRSDESHCEKEGVTERCSFENGKCFWDNNVADLAVAQWTLHTGHEGWPELGPPRDHTKNSAAGHYLTPSQREVSEILSRTLLPSTSCTVRFFYYSLYDAGGNLTVRSRIQTSGDGDVLLWRVKNKHSYSWRRAEATFSPKSKSKIIFHYEHSEGPRGLVAVDDISFSGSCVFDPVNSDLPDTFTTSAPSSTSPPLPCQENEFFCWLSAGAICVEASAVCNYHNDCPQGEDEHGCGPCTFERDACGWTDISDGQTKWKRQKSSNNTVPLTDHTTQNGYYIKVDFSESPSQTEARLQSPILSPASLYCQLQFHFYIKTEASGSLRVLMQQEGGREAILWSRSHSTGAQWTPENLMLGPQQNNYKIWFSSINSGTTLQQDFIVALDDISFINCEKSSTPPALSSFGCSFEDGLCSWLQGAEDDLDWTFGSGPTETPNTGPTGDHTSGKGKYLYLNTSSAGEKGRKAQLKSMVLPPAGEEGHCLSFWYHMFGPTVGSLRMFSQTTDTFEKVLVWQKSGNHGDQWRLMQNYVTGKTGRRVILEATVGGVAGDVAIDDLSVTAGPCAVSGVCDFEEDSCGWTQDGTEDLDWVRQNGSSQNPGPSSDHTTNTALGHYYYLPSTRAGQSHLTAALSSPPYQPDVGSCVQLWYHMCGKDVGTLNIYQRSAGEAEDALLFSQTGDQGPLWRLARAPLVPQVQPYTIVVEGVAGGVAFDDVHLTEGHCPPGPGHCDFETGLCSWTNVGQMDQTDWLRGKGAGPESNTGPPVDHTTNSSSGYYVYVDSSVGQWGDQAFLISDVLQPSTRGHCITFWYHMYRDHVGTLKLHVNDRRTHDAGNVVGLLKWEESGDKGETWNKASVNIKHQEPFWFVFVYQKGKSSEGDVALDDIHIAPSPCYSEPPIYPPEDKHDALTVGLAVGFTVLAGVILSVVLFTFIRKRCHQ
ncbi:MAM and LDL-receptor class A domain-containing protein 2 [Eucyclogobius newberryi]|uniref:MAM and LDL-receptor class A domain-containing protein 2 n=1 Tax=Eucyclogobius newberryi TaxID=166745 RepID=UPI003B5ADCD7